MVQEVVVSYVDKELGAGGVRFHGAGHGDGAQCIGYAIVGFVLDRGAGFFLLHARLKTTALNHEVGDHAVEDGVVVMAIAYVLLEVFDGFRRLVGKEFQGDDTVIGMQLDHVRQSSD